MNLVEKRQSFCYNKEEYLVNRLKQSLIIYTILSAWLKERKKRMKMIVYMIFGYLLGCINPSYIISHIKGFDIRDEGTGNAGTTNTMLVMGKRMAALVLIFDITKTIIAVKVAVIMFPDSLYAGDIAGVMCVVGHIFPFNMKFRGGKGVACFGGLILALSSEFFIPLLLLGLIAAVLINYGCVVPIIASAVYPILYWIKTGSILSALIISIVSVIIIYKHIDNIKKIKNGNEIHFNNLWKKTA